MRRTHGKEKRGRPWGCLSTETAAAEGVNNSLECSRRRLGHHRMVPKCSRSPTEDREVAQLKKERRRACAPLRLEETHGWRWGRKMEMVWIN